MTEHHGPDPEDLPGPDDGVEPPDESGREFFDIDGALAEDDASLADALRALLQPPADIEHRVADTVSDRLVGGSVGSTLIDLLGLGPRTLGMFLSGGVPPADRVREDLPQDDEGAVRR